MTKRMLSIAVLLMLVAVGNIYADTITSAVTADTWLDGLNKDTVRDGSGNIVVNGLNNRLGVLKFDLTGLTTDIVSAVDFQSSLQVRVNYVANPSVRVLVYRLTTDWAADATYNEADSGNNISWAAGEFSSADYYATAYDTQYVTSTLDAGRNTVFDVTELIQYWVNNPGSNYGVALVNNMTNGAQVNISESPSLYEPQIVSTYTVPEPATLCALSMVSGLYLLKRKK